MTICVASITSGIITLRRYIGPRFRCEVTVHKLPRYSFQYSDPIKYHLLDLAVSYFPSNEN